MVIELDMGTSDHPRSLSYTSDTNCNSPHCSSLGWDLHNLGVLNADMSLVMSSAVMGSTPPYFSDLDSDHDLSTGYLEDALLEFGDRSKRRRLSFCGDDWTAKGFDGRALGYWNSACGWGVDENYNGASEITSFTRFSDEMGSSRSRASEDTNFFPEVKAQEDVVSSLDSSSPFKESSSRTKSGSDKEVQFTLDTTPSLEMGAGGEKMRRQERLVLRRVVYPFAVVKPGGADGDVTLNDINERLLMPPTRPVRHPVGDFACRPCVSPHGPGLSGKAVVALTRLHTQGRGTITIIRTKG